MAPTRCLVDNVEQALSFYETIGFQAARQDGDLFAVARLAQHELWLNGPGTLACRSAPGPARQSPGAAPGVRLVLEVRDLRATLQALATSGVRVPEARERGALGSFVLINDPAGNPVELFQHRAPVPG